MDEKTISYVQELFISRSDKQLREVCLNLIAKISLKQDLFFFIIRLYLTWNCLYAIYTLIPSFRIFIADWQWVWELIVWVSAQTNQCAYPLLLKGTPSTYSQAAFIVDAIYVSIG